MLNSEVFSRLKNLIGYIPKQKELIEKTGINQSTLSSKSSRNSKWSEEELKKLNKAYNIDIFKDKSQNNANDELINAFFYPNTFGTMKENVFEFSSNRIPVKIPKNHFFKDINQNKKYSIINAYGDSMLPGIRDNDRLIVEHYEPDEQIQDNHIYVFYYEGIISTKRLIFNIDEVIVKSDNNDSMYKIKYIPKNKMKNLFVIGQIVGIARDLK